MLNPSFFQRLCKCVQEDRRQLAFYREQRYEAVRQFAGNHWSENTSQQKTHVNLLALYTSIVGHALIAKNPRVNLSTFERHAKPTVDAMESWVNRQLKVMGFATTLRRTVLDALFSIGILKVSLAKPAEAARSGWSEVAGQAYIERIDLDDFVADMQCRDFREANYIGHRFRVPLEAVKSDPSYEKVRKELKASDPRLYNEGGDERISALGRSNSRDKEELEDFVDLWELYLPRHGVVVTMADAQVEDNDILTKPLRVQKWVGPYCGPYHILGFGVVPGNPMPKAPVQNLIELHMLANHLYRKIARQAERQKEVLLVPGAAMADSKAIKDASDGEIVKTDNAQGVAPVSFGGANQANFALAQHVVDRFSWQAGNLDLAGGLSPQAKTLGQDRMLEENASKGIKELQDQTTDFVNNAVESMLWFWWNDAFQVIKSKYAVPGFPDIAVQRMIGPQERQLPFEELDIRVDPYSMQYQTPQQIIGSVNEVLQTLAPFMPMLQQQGIGLDANALVKMFAQYRDIPEIADLFTIHEPIEPESSPSGGKPAQTSREYIRKSVGQDTAANRQAEMLNQPMEGEAA